MGYKMNGSPHKMGTIQGTSGHASALKSHVEGKPVWEGHYPDEETYNKASKSEKNKKINVRGKLEFDPVTGRMIKPPKNVKTEVTGGQTIGEGGKIINDTKIKTTTTGLSIEDQMLANKYQNLHNKSSITQNKLNEQISTRNVSKSKNLKSKVTKAQGKLDESKKNLETTNSKVEELQNKIKNLNKSDGLIRKSNDPNIRKNLEKELNEARKDQKFYTKKVDRRTKKLDKKQTKSTDFEEGGGKRAKGNLFTRMKSNRQQKQLRKQRNYINMSDEERRNYDRMKVHNRAELIRGMSSKHKANIYLDPKEYAKSGGKPELDNKKSFNDLMAEYEKMSKTNPDVKPVDVNPNKNDDEIQLNFLDDPTKNWPKNLSETDAYIKTLKK